MFGNKIPVSTSGWASHLAKDVKRDGPWVQAFSEFARAARAGTAAKRALANFEAVPFLLNPS